MHLSLECHKETPSTAVSEINVEIVRTARGGVLLSYVLSGDIDRVLIPQIGVPSRQDGLWEHTCFEVFMRPWDGAGYIELNFSPSTAWAAYRFREYRQSMKNATPVDRPSILSAVKGDGFHLNAEVDLSGLPEFLGDLPWQTGLSAVIEDADGGKSYWALAHPRGKPDFHHEDCFVYELKPGGSK